METRVNWSHICDLLQLHFSAPGSCPAFPPLNPNLGPVAGFFERCNEPWGFIKGSECSELVEQMSLY
jgi:hypothetical protein